MTTRGVLRKNPQLSKGQYRRSGTNKEATFSEGYKPTSVCVSWHGPAARGPERSRGGVSCQSPQLACGKLGGGAIFTKSAPATRGPVGGIHEQV